VDWAVKHRFLCPALRASNAEALAELKTQTFRDVCLDLRRRVLAMPAHLTGLFATRALWIEICVPVQDSHVPRTTRAAVRRMLSEYPIACDPTASGPRSTTLFHVHHATDFDAKGVASEVRRVIPGFAVQPCYNKSVGEAWFTKQLRRPPEGGSPRQLTILVRLLCVMRPDAIATATNPVPVIFDSSPTSDRCFGRSFSYCVHGITL
jgi:hypothetical protein